MIDFVFKKAASIVSRFFSARLFDRPVRPIIIALQRRIEPLTRYYYPGKSLPPINPNYRFKSRSLLYGSVTA